MNHDSTERTLRRRFQELRRSDERTAPAFARVWQAAERGTRNAERGATSAAWGWTLKLAAAATCAALVLVGVWFMVRDASGPGRGAPPDAAGLLVAANAALSNLPGDARALSQWTSPTEFLLDVPGALMWEPVPGPQ